MSSINLLLTAAIWAAPEAGFLDVTDAVGLGPDVIGQTVSRLCMADLNGDGYPDAVIDRHRVFLNEPDAGSPIGRRFIEVPKEKTGLLPPVRGTVTVFADLDNDGHIDALIAEYIDKNNEKWEDHGRRTRWQKGNGDGTFGEARPIVAAKEATTCAVAVGDVNDDARPDLYLGNWYRQYGAGYEGHTNDLLTSVGAGGWVREALGEDRAVFSEERDLAGRPTYGACIARIGSTITLLDLNYGRRWNRAWQYTSLETWLDVARPRGLDGDAIRHGQYPEWAVQRMAQRDPPIELEPEMPFRSNGNTFDCAVGDIDNDGDFDLFLAEIAHGWAGESSDRSRFLVNRLIETGNFRFQYDAKRCVDRIPPDKDNWNQGDLFCALADLNHDTRLDLVLSSGDYPDDQRLRVFLQQEDRAFADSTAALGLDHDGSQQISLGDVDGDGDLDILVGQTFFRYSAEQKAGRSPHVRLFINEATEGRRSVTLRLKGDGVGAARDALGAIVRATLPDGTVMSRQLIGIGGHAGKQMDFIVHFGLGHADRLDELIVRWPGPEHAHQRFENVKAGRYTLTFGGELEKQK